MDIKPITTKYDNDKCNGCQFKQPATGICTREVPFQKSCTVCVTKQVVTSE